MRLRDEVVFITGASRGIGAATAVASAREGARVALLGTDSAAGEEVATTCRASGGEAMWLAVDLEHEDEIASAVARVVDAWGRIDVLINNAAIYAKGTVVTTSRDDWERLMRVNVTAAYLCARHALPPMIAGGGGSVVNVASEAGLVGIANQTAYNVSKAALISLTQSMALDFVGDGVRVNCVCPGTTLTPLVEAAIAREADPEGERVRLGAVRPMNRLGRPEEIAEAIVFLASDAASYATGAVLAVDGGYTAR
jgi:NAD(P)-dependent dehydrogenase (short-subunit alcohol dehydrogenase family)